MIILALETSYTQGSLAIVNLKTLETLYEDSWSKENSHSELITLKITEALDKTKLSF